MPALTSQTELAKEGIRHLGYPEYFGNALVIFKVLVQPNKKDDGQPCSYYVLVTLENSSYDQNLKDG
jgi:hypothetical protein